MRKILAIGLISIFIAVISPAELWAQYDRSFRMYLDLAQEAIAKKDYKSAYLNLQAAQSIKPDSTEPLKYFNYLQRLQQKRVTIVTAQPVVVTPGTSEKRTLSPSSHIRRAAVTTPPIVVERVRLKGPPPTTETVTPDKGTPTSSALGTKDVTKSPPGTIPPWPTSTSPAAERPTPPTMQFTSVKPQRTIYLNEDLWQKQPDTRIEIEIGTAVILEGDEIQRFLIVTPGAITVQQPNSRQLILAAQKRGATFFHVWQNERRWTFRVNTIFPLATENDARTFAPKREVYTKPFEFLYNNDWDSYYRGRDSDTIKRQNLNFRQWMGLFGETPYGKLDSSVNFYMFEDSTEATGYGVGLTNGQFGNFKDFTIRGFDTSKQFSDLSLPGRYFRGVLFESPAFDNKIQYTVLHGQDLATYDYLAPGGTVLRKSYIEGARIMFSPEYDQTYAVNYARGWGEMRPKEFKDRVYSVEAQKMFDRTTLYSELAYDESDLGYNLRADHQEANWKGSWQLRDVDKNFYTISGSPSGQGQLGTLLNWQWQGEKVTMDTFLDLYRDRLNLNPAHPDAVNADFNTNASIPLTEDASWRTSFYYTDTPGLLTTRQDFRLGNTFMNSWDIVENRPISYFFGHNYQRSRSMTTPGAEYDRNSLNAGFRLPLVGRLSYFLNYEYSWVTDISTNTSGQPQVLNTGLNYSYRLTKSLSGYAGVIYRDEENTDNVKSFLAGEDSIAGSVGLTYQPKRDFQLFMDGNVRDVWAENPAREPYLEANLHFGLKSRWDLPFSWSPSGMVQGTIFKDNNGNGIKEPGEPGIAGVKVKVGEKTLTTDAQGQYKRGVRAQKVLVSVEVDSVPEGYVFSRQITKEIFIQQGKTQTANFGLTVNSGIYGVIYYDANKNGALDSEDTFISKVNITLDGTETATTDAEGSFNFSNIQPGQHHVSVDLNSIPMEYLPLIKLDQMVDVAEGTTYLFHMPLKKK